MSSHLCYAFPPNNRSGPSYGSIYSNCTFLVMLSPQLPTLKFHLPPVLSYPFSLAVKDYPGLESDFFFFSLWLSGEISLFKEILSKTSLASTLKLLPPRSFFVPFIYLFKLFLLC